MCEHNNSAVVDTRKNSDGRYRRYKCNDCGERWSTMEVRVAENGKKGKSFIARFNAEYRGPTEEQRKAVEILAAIELLIEASK